MYAVLFEKKRIITQLSKSFSYKSRICLYIQELVGTNQFWRNCDFEKPFIKLEAKFFYLCLIPQLYYCREILVSQLHLVLQPVLAGPPRAARQAPVLGRDDRRHRVHQHPLDGGLDPVLHIVSQLHYDKVQPWLIVTVLAVLAFVYMMIVTYPFLLKFVSFNLLAGFLLSFMIVWMAILSYQALLGKKKLCESTVSSYGLYITKMIPPQTG